MTNQKKASHRNNDLTYKWWHKPCYALVITSEYTFAHLVTRKINNYKRRFENVTFVPNAVFTVLDVSIAYNYIRGDAALCYGTMNLNTMLLNGQYSSFEIKVWTRACFQFSRSGK